MVWLVSSISVDLSGVPLGGGDVYGARLFRANQELGLFERKVLGTASASPEGPGLVVIHEFEQPILVDAAVLRAMDVETRQEKNTVQLHDPLGVVVASHTFRGVGDAVQQEERVSVPMAPIFGVLPFRSSLAMIPRSAQRLLSAPTRIRGGGLRLPFRRA